MSLFYMRETHEESQNAKLKALGRALGLSGDFAENPSARPLR